MSLLDIARSAIADQEQTLSLELERLINRVAVYYGCPPNEVREMKQTAMRDQMAALESFRLMAVEIESRRRTLPAITDDRITCASCSALKAGRCTSMDFPHSPEYRPDTTVQRRCEGYVPMPEDKDRRTASERWPGLAKVIPITGAKK